MNWTETEQTERIGPRDAGGQRGDKAMKGNILRAVTPYRFLIAAAVLAAIFCLLPVQVDAPEEQSGELLAQEQTAPQLAAQATALPGVPGLPVGADLSERTQENAYLHRTATYSCGHSVQRREQLPTRLCGLSRTALEAEIGEVIPGAHVTGFSAQEVDIAIALNLPCPLHWVLRAGEGGKLEVLQNVTGEALSVVRETEIEQGLLDADTQAALHEGMVFDDVQQLEGYLESLDS